MRSVVNRLYADHRGLEAGLDDNLQVTELATFLADKLIQRVRGALRGVPRTFVGKAVVIRGRRRLRIGRSVSIANHVEISAIGTEGIFIGDHSTIDAFSCLRASGVLRNLGHGIHIGNRVSIGRNNFIHGGGGVEIGDDTLLGPDVSIFSENHNTSDRDRTIRSQSETRARVHIGRDVWVGSGARVMAGTRIGDGAIIAAGAIVTRDVEPMAVVAGVPARRIGTRGDTA